MKADHQHHQTVVLFGSWRHVSVSRHVELSQSRLILPAMCPPLGPKPPVTEGVLWETGRATSEWIRDV